MSVSQPAAEDTSNNPASNVSDSDEVETENPENTGPSPDTTQNQDVENANSQSDSASSPVTAKSLEDCAENGADGEQQGKGHDEEQAVPVSGLFALLVSAKFNQIR